MLKLLEALIMSWLSKRKEMAASQRPPRQNINKKLNQDKHKDRPIEVKRNSKVVSFVQVTFYVWPLRIDCSVNGQFAACTGLLY